MDGICCHVYYLFYCLLYKEFYYKWPCQNYPLMKWTSFPVCNCTGHLPSQSKSHLCLCSISVATTRKVCWKVPWKLNFFFPCLFFFFLMKNRSVLEVTRRMSSQPNMAFSEHHNIIAKIPYTCIGEIGVVGQTNNCKKNKNGN